MPEISYDQQKELWDAFYTHPERMDGEEAASQNDAVEKQISSFEKLLQHAMSRFSRDTYYSVLDTLSRRERSKNPAGRGKIDSVSQLSRIKDELIRQSFRRGARKEQDSGIVKYLEGYSEDLQYLKDLKKYFDEKIYSCLYQYFYDPKFEENDDDESAGSRTTRSKRHGTNDDIDFSELTDKQKLGQAISQLQDINTKWDALLTEDDLDEYMFDPDSYHEIVQFKDFKPFELMFRLFPDLFVKAYKSIEVAKTWWTQANIVNPRDRRSGTVEVDFNYKLSAMEHLVAKLEDDIKEEENLLVSEQESLTVLKQREGRWSTLNENCTKTEEAKQDADMRYNHMKLKRQSLVQEMKEPEVRDDSEQYDQITSKLEKLDNDMWEAYDQLHLLSFQLKILNQDLDVEMTVRPEMIRYLGSLEDKVVAIERSLSQKKNSKEESEKQLQAIRRNLHSMKDIMISRSNTELQSFEHGNSRVSNERHSRASEQRNNPEEQYGYSQDEDSTDRKASRSDKKTSQYNSDATKSWKPRPAYVRRRSKKDRDY